MVPRWLLLRPQAAAKKVATEDRKRASVENVEFSCAAATKSLIESFPTLRCAQWLFWKAATLKGLEQISGRVGRVPSYCRKVTTNSLFATVEAVKGRRDQIARQSVNAQTSHYDLLEEYIIL